MTFACGLGILLAAAGSLAAQPLRTRDVTRLSQFDIARYLQRNNVLFVPVGSVEGNGLLPSDHDYAVALGVAMRMAEAADGLYAPNLSYFYAGSTATAAATVNVSLAQSREYLKAVAKSFLRQGFATQVWVTAGHGPAPLIVGSMVREFLDETQTPILAIDAVVTARRLKIETARLAYGAYSLLGRIGDLPLAADAPPGTQGGGGAEADNAGLAALRKLGYSGSLTLGFWYADPNAHLFETRDLPRTAGERAARGKKGEEEIEALVQAMRIPGAVAALKEHARYTREVIVPKYGTMVK